MPRQGRPWIGQLGLRLTLAFVGVALAGIAVLAALTALSSGQDIAQLARRQQESLTVATAVAAGAAYDRIGWRRADLRPILDLVSRDGASAQVLDRDGNVVGSSSGFSRTDPDLQTNMPVVAYGRQVGQVTVRFGDRGLGAVVPRFDAARWRARIESAGVAALLALAVSLLVSRWITAPIETTLAAMRKRVSGDRGYRISQSDMHGMGVLRELLEGYNVTTDVLDQQDQVRRNLVADVAHELRTPVAILQAGHEAMLDGLAEPTTENLGSLRDEVLRLSRMVEDLQRLSAAEAATLQLKRVPYDLAVIAAEAAASLSDAYEVAGVRLTARLREARVMCDPGRIRDVITNLLTNALKFTPAGGTVILEAEPAGRELARLKVSDTGMGIAPEELPRVTERFFRGQRSADVAAGSGIGLTIVAELVRAHDGSLDIKSELGKGTQVTIMLPGAGKPVPAS
ncbi:MAG TPA: ATP-binding protein [Streptosporangiaceae bacterium]|nr:ATP-binding protein [Streptosporangiaceae bacterium]